VDRPGLRRADRAGRSSERTEWWISTRASGPYAGPSPERVRAVGPRSEGLEPPASQIRRLGQVVRDCPGAAVFWADIPGLSPRDGGCLPAWQQYWQQSRWLGTRLRPSAFQAGHIPSWRGSCECYALPPVATGSRRLLLLLSPLLSAAASTSLRNLRL